MRRSITPIVIAGLLLSAVPFAAPAQALPPGAVGIASYSVVTSRDIAPSGLIARAVLPAGTACPSMSVTVDGRSVSVRSIPRRPGVTTWPAFASVKVCEARIPVGATAAQFAGRRIPAAMPARVDRLALFGDTGCRISPTQVQDCADPRAWPLATIAARIADERPDVIVHAGDYFYRESPCPIDATGQCGGEPVPLPGYPFDDSQYGWVADALLPLTPMFEAAPILFTRGNHEICSRGGNGYYLFLDPGWQNADACAPIAGQAPTHTDPPFRIDLPVDDDRTLRLVVVDSANGFDGSTGMLDLPGKRRYYERAQQLAAGADDVWLVTHRPIFSLISSTFAPAKLKDWTQWGSVGEQIASRGLLGRYDLILGSHVHLAQSVQIPGAPGQLVLGNGGTLLDPTAGYEIPDYGPLALADGRPILDAVPPYPPASSVWTDVRFGYAIATPATAGGWALAMRGADGRSLARCAAADRMINCR